MGSKTDIEMDLKAKRVSWEPFLCELGGWDAQGNGFISSISHVIQR